MKVFVYLVVAMDDAAAMENIGLIGDRALWTLCTCEEDTIDFSYESQGSPRKGQGIEKAHLLGCCVERYCLNSTVVYVILETTLNTWF